MATRKTVDTIYRVRDRAASVLRRLTGLWGQNAEAAESASTRIDRAVKTKDRSVSGLLARLGRLRFAYFAIAGVVTSVIASFRNFVTASRVQEQAEEKLRAALSRTGQATDANLQKLTQLAAERQKSTRFGDEMTISAQASLATFGLQADQIATLTPLVQDMAEANRRAGQSNVALERTAQIVGQAVSGNVGNLSRYGIVLSDVERRQFQAADSAGRFEIVAKALEERFGGMAQALTPFELAVESAGNGFGDFREKLGRSITQSPAILSALNGVRERFEQLATGFETHGGTIERVISGVVSTFQVLFNTARIVFNSLMAAARTFAANWLSLFSRISEQIAKLPLGSLAERFGKAADEMREDSERLRRDIQGNLDNIGESAHNFVEAGRNLGDALTGAATAGRKAAQAADEQARAEKARQEAIERTNEALNQFGIDADKVETGISSTARSTTAALVQMAADGEASLAVLGAAAEKATENFDSTELTFFRIELERAALAGRITQEQLEAISRPAAELTDNLKRIEEALRNVTDANELAALESEIESLRETGELTAEEYRRLINTLRGLKDELNDIQTPTKEAGDEVDETADSLKDAAEATKEWTQTLSEAEETTGGFAAALANLLLPVRQLSEGASVAVDDLVKGLRGVKIPSGFLKQLNSGLRDIRQEFELQTSSADAWVEAINAGSQEALQMAENALAGGEQLRLLDQQRLDGLRNAIESARAAMNRFTEDTRRGVEQLQDELLQVQGKTDELEARRFQRRREEIRAQLQQANLSQEARNNLQEQLRILDEIGRVRRDQAQESERAANASRQTSRELSRHADEAERVTEAERETSRELERQANLRRQGALNGNGGVNKSEIEIKVTGDRERGLGLSEMEINTIVGRVLASIERDQGRTL